MCLLELVGNVLIEPVLHFVGRRGEAFDGSAREPTDLDLAGRDRSGARLAAERAPEKIAGTKQPNDLLATIGWPLIAQLIKGSPEYYGCCRSAQLLQQRSQ